MTTFSDEYPVTGKPRTAAVLVLPLDHLLGRLLLEDCGLEAAQVRDGKLYLRLTGPGLPTVAIGEQMPRFEAVPQQEAKELRQELARLRAENEALHTYFSDFENELKYTHAAAVEREALTVAVRELKDRCKREQDELAHRESLFRGELQNLDGQLEALSTVEQVLAARGTSPPVLAALVAWLANLKEALSALLERLDRRAPAITRGDRELARRMGAARALLGG